MGRCAPSFAQGMWVSFYGAHPLASALASLATPTKGRGASGGCGGKAAKLPAPPTAAQRKQIYGIGAPEGPRFHMNDEAA